MNRKFNRPLVLWALLSLVVCTALLALSGCNNPANQPLEITSVFPADGGTEVPRTTALEITFSVPPDKLDEFFTVDPPVEGRFEYLENTVIFLPTQEGMDYCWATGTQYTVTVKAGAKARDGRGTLAEDYSFSFTIADDETAYYEGIRVAETFLPDDYPVLELNIAGYYSEEPLSTQSFDVTVHRLPDGDSYLQQLYKAVAAGDTVRMDTSGLTQVLSFSQKAEELNFGKGQAGEIILPQPLETGWYVATVLPDGDSSQAVQKLLQIQNSAVYSQTSDEHALFWFNSTATGEAMPDVTMEIIKNPFDSTKAAYSFEADENGIVAFDLPEMPEVLSSPQPDAWNVVGGRTRYFYAAKSSDGTVYYDCISPYYMSTPSPIQEYYSFLYTDRPIYRRDDTVKFWGIARPRKDNQPLDEVEVMLYHDWSTQPFQTLTLPVGEDGIFTGEMSFQGLSSGSLEIRVYPGGTVADPDVYQPSLCSEYLSISQYKKPIYTGSLTTDKLYYRPGEAIQAELEVTLFDRTPAAGVTMLLDAPNTDQRSLTTDEEGLASTLYTALAAEDSYATDWRPREFTITAQNGDASDVNISISDTVYVFPTTVMVEAEEERQGDRSNLTITAHNIDFSKIPGGRQVIQNYDNLQGTPAQVEVHVALRKIAYVKNELEPYYDRYTKTMVPRYTYERTEEVVKEFEETTGADGTLVLQDLLPPEEEGVFYYADITVTDGGYQSTTISLGNRWYYTPEDRNGHLHTFFVDNGDPENIPVAGKGYYYGSTSFDFGQELAWQVMDNGVPVESGSVMTNLLQQGLLREGQVGGPQGSILCGEETLPNFTLCGAYFDGKRIYPVRPATLSVDPDSRSLNLEILPDQEDYRPGDTAKVTLRLTGQDGNPIPGANVCLGVVDESIFAIQEQYVQLGYDLYRDVYYNYPNVSASYIQHGADIYYDEGGKGGGGGGEGVTTRQNFQDTVGLYTGVTGTDGTVSFQVQMPDNLTQWRLTALAVDGSTYWGQSRSQLYTTLPFRIDPILSSTFLSGDTIACTVRGFGTGIDTQDMVEYTAVIEGYDEELEVTAQAEAGTTTPLVFQKLPAGSYSMTVTARCGDYTDSVKLPFQVQDSALLFRIHRTLDLSQESLESVQPSLFPVEVAIYNQGHESFFQAWNLLYQDTSGRADAKLAMESVRETMTAFFGEGYEHPETDLSEVQTGLEDGKGLQGGISLFPYSEPDVQTTARAAVTASNLVNRSQLAYYLHECYQGTSDSTDRAAALMGLAALGELSEDETLVLQSRAQVSGLPARESEYLIAGLSYIDLPAAQKLYSHLIVPLFQEDRSGLYIPQDTAYDTVDATAGALACAILTGDADDAQALLSYLSQNSTTPFGTTRGPCQLEAALYLNRFQLKDEDLPTIRYTLDGETHTETLSRNGCLNLTLTKEEFENLDLQVEKGTALASVYFTGTPEQLNFTSSPRITVTKTMDTPENQKHLGGETDIIIKVDLSEEMPYGQYQLVEWIPSNMRLRGVDNSYNPFPFSWHDDEQLLTVNFFYGEDTGNTFTFRYTATSVLDTECTLERAYAYCLDTMEGSWTEKGEFLPSDYYYLGVGYLFRKE